MELLQLTTAQIIYFMKSVNDSKYLQIIEYMLKLRGGLVIGLSKISSCFPKVMIKSFFNRVQKGDVKSTGM